MVGRFHKAAKDAAGGRGIGLLSQRRIERSSHSGRFRSPDMLPRSMTSLWRPCSQFPLLFKLMPLQPYSGGLFHDIRRGPIQVERSLLDRSNDVRIHGRQELSFVAWGGFSAPSWRRFCVRHRSACALCNPGNRPMGCHARQVTGAKAWLVSPDNLSPILLLMRRNSPLPARMPSKY